MSTFFVPHQDKLHQAIAQLPEKQRRRLVLYYFGEFTYEQIAAMEGCKFQVIAKSIKTPMTPPTRNP